MHDRRRAGRRPAAADAQAAAGDAATRLARRGRRRRPGRRRRRREPRSRCRWRWRATRSGWPASSFDALDAGRARAALPADVAPASWRRRCGAPAATSAAATASASTCAGRCARSLRTGGDPIRLARRRRRVVPRRLVMLCDISGSMEPYARAYLQFLTCAAGSGPNAEAFVFATRLTRLTRALRVAPPRARDPARGRGRAGLVERHPDRRRAEGVQRPPRPARHGPRRGGRDPLRRLGARRPGARRAARWSAWRGSPTGSCGSTRASSATAFSVRGRRHGRGAAALRRAGQRPQLRGPRRGRRRDRRRPPGMRRPPSRRRRPPTSRSRGRAPRPVPGSSVAMPSGHGPSRGNTTPGWVDR